MKHLTLKYCKAIVCLSIFMLSTVCGSAQCYRHCHIRHIDPWVIDHNLNAIAREAMFEGIVLHNVVDAAINTSNHVAFDHSDLARLYAKELAINTTGALAYDLLSLSDISDRGLRNAGIALTCAQIALSASAIHQAEQQARKEAVEAQAQESDAASNEENEQREQIRKKENKALTTLAIIGAAAWTLDALFGDYPAPYRHRYYHRPHRHYHPYY